MRAVIQRVSEASVSVEGRCVGRIASGLMVLLGVDISDDAKDAELMAEKIAFLRVFSDPDGKMNVTVQDSGGKVLLISQFTLLGDCRKGRRPSFITAARPEQAVPLLQKVRELLLNKYEIPVEEGVFGAHMQVSLINDGPVTLLIDTKKYF
ncbi:MAG TPA: D-aminoacyl-tRNA deacylase [Candidatus Hydrogenedentes bacterium]|mgnify:CR=1 FL=1|nr:MAG: D-tyrosyl-tRNA(Tyr) deacylase [Candidatus Hydrogenedentes bacterium ADurb.Bin170]HOD95570.1 D-aminoacyl-tRNA deacylase [Candidatus Hydrogenedentota bacterium]HOH42646.1 D-aminoacyl-tRNA deacylase [Candidatus Hydrogenedentota bacterium]HOM48509.1 D-aminoacyl-tRNA deacylase [Candidatus Hydrogenedentota bacterium]HOR50984.1 D-aminoacyl-tRNA deacylase [Candidatus Hydrogenedentota bacterium]